jgi:hypothetical protein
VTLGSNPLLAQPEQAVDIHISGETCLIGNLDVPCSDVGAKLRELGVIAFSEWSMRVGRFTATYLTTDPWER